MVLILYDFASAVRDPEKVSAAREPERCAHSDKLVTAIKMPGILLGDVFPNFEADTTKGKIKFHDFLGDG